MEITYIGKRCSVRDAKCRKLACFQPGEYQTRGAAGAGGSRATGSSKFCCLRRAYHGCPTTGTAERRRGND